MDKLWEGISSLVIPFILASFGGIIQQIATHKKWTFKATLSSILCSGFAGILCQHLGNGFGFSEGITKAFILLGGFGGTYTISILYNKVFLKKFEIDISNEEELKVDEKNKSNKSDKSDKSDKSEKEEETDNKSIKIGDSCKKLYFDEQITKEVLTKEEIKINSKLTKLVLINLYNCGKITEKDFTLLSSVYISSSIASLLKRLDRDEISREEFFKELKRL